MCKPVCYLLFRWFFLRDVFMADVHELLSLLYISCTVPLLHEN